MFLNFTTIVDPIVKFFGEWLKDVNFYSIIIRLLLAVLCGGIIGIERATRRHAAGFRTYILVCVGACMATLTNQFIFQQFDGGDIARLGAQVISGIGFLGAGTILVTSKNQIKGLTTAAGLWACACMGLGIGVGFYTLALVAVMIIMLALTLLPKIESYFTERTRSMEIHVEFENRTDLKDFITYVRNQDLKIVSLEYNTAYSSTGISVYTIAITQEKKKMKNHIEIINDIKKLPFVNHVEEIY